MAELKPIDVVQVLADEIGPRPTGTEEEQRAALAIQQWFEQAAGLPAAIEEVEGDPELDTARNICFFASFIMVFLAYIMKFLAVPAVVICLAAAVILVLESLGKPVITRLLRKGISQNVVAVYEPDMAMTQEEAERSGRARKIVLVARYDSSRVRAETNGALAGLAVFANTAEFFALLLAPILVLLRGIFINNTGLVASILNVLTVILLVVLGLAVLKALARRFAKYNDGANCNASGVAVMLDVAQRINGFNAGPVQTPRRHGAAAAEAAGVVPEGADLQYDAPRNTADDAFTAQPENAPLGAATAAAAAAGLGAAYGLSQADQAQAAPVAEAPAPVAETPADTFASSYAWRGRATANTGYATAGSNMEVSVRQAGAAVGSGMSSNAFTRPVVDQAAGRTAVNAGSGAVERVTESSAALRTAADNPVYSSDNPRLEAARAALRARSVIPEEQQQAQQAAPAGYRYSVDEAYTPHTANAQDLSWARGVQDVQYSTRAARTAKPASSATAEEEKPKYTKGWEAPNPVAVVVAADDDALVTRPVVETTPAADEAPVFAIPEPEAVEPQVEAYVPEPEPQPAPEPVIPDWFTAAKANARRSGADVVVERSRYGDALQHAYVTAEQNVEAALAAQAKSQAQEEGTEFVGDTTYHEFQMPTFVAPAAQAEPQYVKPTYEVPTFDVPEYDPAIVNAPAPTFEATAAPATGFAGALAAAQAAVDRKTAEGIAPDTFGMAQVTLPDLGSTSTMKPITQADLQQRAPLAETSGTDVAKSLLTMLPSIDLADPTDASATPAASLTEALPQVAAAPDTAMGMAGMTGTFAPVGNDLMSGSDADDMFVDDADDSDFQQNFTSTGAFAGPSYMDMPKKTRKGFLSNLFGKKDKEQRVSNWRQQQAEADAYAQGYADEYGDGYGYDDQPADDGYRNWNGGAFSFKLPFGRKKAQEEDDFGEEEVYGYDDEAGYDDFTDFSDQDGYGFDDQAYAQYAQGFAQYDEQDAQDGYAPEEDFEAAPAAAPAATKRSGRHGRGAHASRSTRASRKGGEDAENRSSSLDAFARSTASDPDLQQIFDFRDGNINAEVWFVALGSESPNNSGMRAFLDAHGAELRGAVIVELEGLGAGNLCLTKAEGKYRKMNVGSRMRRYVQKAQEAMGIRVGDCAYRLDTSATYCALAKGFQAMHLVGMDGAKPAYQNQANDVVQIIDEEKLQRNADFVMELVRSI